MSSLVDMLLRSLKSRKHYARLQELDDYLLTDIGLSRNDLRELMAGDRIAQTQAGRATR